MWFVVKWLYVIAESYSFQNFIIAALAAVGMAPILTATFHKLADGLSKLAVVQYPALKKIGDGLSAILFM